MLSLRAFARSAPRAASRLAASSRRPCAASCSLLAAKGAAPRVLLPRAGASFATTAKRGGAVGETDDELSAKLDSEMAMEANIKDSEQVPASVKDYLDNSPFDLIDEPGKETVKLRRQFGDEQITVSFSCSDFRGFDPLENDSALEDEELGDSAIQNTNKQSHVPSSGGARSAAAEEQLEDEAEDEDPMDDEGGASTHLDVTIEKPGKTKGALSIGVDVQYGTLSISSMYYYEDASLASPGAPSPEVLHKRADLYVGPAFESLDEDLQVLMDRYLEERDITQALAVFVQDYVDVKEQKEYLNWLANIKGFVDA